MDKPRLLVVDDEPSIAQLIRNFFESRGLEVVIAGDCQTGVEAVERVHPDVALVDYRLPDGTALDLLSRWRTGKLSFPVIVLTGHGTIDLAVRAIREGAENFVTKPIKLESLLVMVERALANARNRRAGLATRSREARHVIDPFVGTSPGDSRTGPGGCESRTGRPTDPDSG